MTKFRVTLTFQIPENLTKEQVQDYISELLLSGQISVDTSVDIELLDITGKIK